MNLDGFITGNETRAHSCPLPVSCCVPYSTSVSKTAIIRCGPSTLDKIHELKEISFLYKFPTLSYFVMVMKLIQFMMMATSGRGKQKIRREKSWDQTQVPIKILVFIWGGRIMDNYYITMS